MTDTTTTSRATSRAAAPATPSLASSTRFGTFVITFAIVGPILYLICLFWNLPLVSYHPAVNRLDLGLTAPRSGEGPAMYWYGWTLTVFLAGGILGILATMLPQGVTRRLPLFLVWLLPILSVPFLIYSLRGLLFHP